MNTAIADQLLWIGEFADSISEKGCPLKGSLFCALRKVKVSMARECQELCV